MCFHLADRDQFQLDTLLSAGLLSSRPVESAGQYNWQSVTDPMSCLPCACHMSLCVEYPISKYLLHTGKQRD